MDIIGIIAEYNPFHNGHIYHINKIKEKYPDAILILVLNGYFLERGEISILTKEEKTRIALEYGVNIVLELPFLMGSQSADIFADASIKILNNYHVNKIIFGSECNDVSMLTNIAKAQFKDDFDELVKNYMDEGCNYPTALARACKVNFDFNPNDLLGISYIKAIINNNFNIDADVIKRTNSYHDKTSNEEIVSASNIREKIKENIDITNYLPNEVVNSLIRIDYSIFFKLLKSKIITDNDLSSYVDVDEGIEYRLKKYINDNVTIINYATYCAKVLNQNDELVYEEDLHGMWPINRYVNLLTGEIPRLSDDANGYGPNGKNYIAHVDIPENVKIAFEELKMVFGSEIRPANPLYATNMNKNS